MITSKAVEKGTQFHPKMLTERFSQQEWRTFQYGRLVNFV